jgi:hypothetical protein
MGKHLQGLVYVSARTSHMVSPDDYENVTRVFQCTEETTVLDIMLWYKNNVGHKQMVVQMIEETK